MINVVIITLLASLATGGCFVMAACAADESSYELGQGENAYGVFTGSLLTGLGFRVPGDAAVDPAADRNGDGAVSFQEAFAYARDQTAAIVLPYGVTQTAACYPADCGWFAPFRYR